MNPARALLFALKTTTVLLPTYLCAQSINPSGDQLQEIIVTAEKRAENVLNVPISISVLNQKAMQDLAVQNLADVAAITPGLDYANTGGVNTLAIRGISDSTGYATTGMYIDDIPIEVRRNFVTLYGTSEPDVFDLERVEVLRGPQGTLYGAGAEGGLIRFVTPEPSLTENSGFSRVSAGQTSGGSPSYEIGAASGGPIVSDELGFRVSAWYRRDGGYIQYDSPLGGYKADNGDWKDSTAVRAALTWAPTDAIRVTTSFFFQDVYTNNENSFEPATSLATNDYYIQQWGVLHPQFSNPGNGYFVNPNTLQTPSDDNFSLPALKVVWTPGAVALTSNTAYMHRRNDLVNDNSNYVPYFYGFPHWATVPYAVEGGYQSIAPTQNVLSEEVRLQSVTPDRPFEWTVGVFYSNQRQQIVDINHENYIAQYIQSHTGLTYEEYTGLPLIQPGNIDYIAYEHDKDEQTAAYGQASYHLTKQWAVLAGVRVAREQGGYSYAAKGGLLFGPPSQFSGGTSETVVDPKFGVNYQVTPDNLLYVSAAKGDRIGGVNTPPLLNVGGACEAALASLGTGSAYKSDYLWSYELGSKNSVAGGRVSLQASAFYIDWKQVQFPLFVQACGSSFITNLGAAASDGFDFQGTALVAKGLELGLSVGYTHATVTKSIPSDGKLAAVSGDQLNDSAAPWIGSVTVQYTFALGDGHQGYVHLDDTYHSKNPGPFAEDNPNSIAYNPIPLIPNPAYNVLNTHVGVKTGNWDVSVYALNLLNSHPILYDGENGVLNPVGGAFTIRPLTFGATAQYRW
jgi:iron complex outermembrane receptor protein